MSTRILLTALLLTSAAASPASANWFNNPFVNINLNIGSAPNPTPDDVLAATLPLLVRDTDGNIIAMIDSSSGQVIATVEPQAAPKAPRTAARPVIPSVR